MLEPLIEMIQRLDHWLLLKIEIMLEPLIGMIQRLGHWLLLKIEVMLEPLIGMITAAWSLVAVENLKSCWSR